ncbi:MAG TPA: hypothetical protein VNK05_08955 [Chloroflexota bacterium]|jgi:hypothetical protein|nr:hypothetical protein [Chloroflexota bacterium]
MSAFAPDPATSAAPLPATDEPLPRRCTIHPDRETYVACGRCERPFCPECLIQTPAGQRCYECAGVRRDYAQRAFVRRLAQAFGVIALGGGIAAVLPGIIFVLFAGLIAGGAAGQGLSPLVNRRTRRRIYLLGLLVLLAGAVLGWVVAQTILVSARVPLSQIPFDVLIARAVQSLPFWLYTIAAGAVGYQRVR